MDEHTARWLAPKGTQIIPQAIPTEKDLLSFIMQWMLIMAMGGRVMPGYFNSVYNDFSDVMKKHGLPFDTPDWVAAKIKEDAKSSQKS